MTEKEQAITPEVFDHLVQLAALELDEKQAEYLRRELNSQLSRRPRARSYPVGP